MRLKYQPCFVHYYMQKSRKIRGTVNYRASDIQDRIHRFTCAVCHFPFHAYRIISTIPIAHVIG